MGTVLPITTMVPVHIPTIRTHLTPGSWSTWKRAPSSRTSSSQTGETAVVRIICANLLLNLNYSVYKHVQCGQQVIFLGYIIDRASR